MSSHKVPFEMYKSPLSQAPQKGTTGNITIDRSPCYVPVDTTAGAAALTLNAPTKRGIYATICLEVDNGDLTLTVTDGYNEDGDTSITFDSAGNWLFLASIDVGGTPRWQIVSQEGTTAVTEEGTFDTLTAAAGTITTGTVTTLGSTTATIADLTATSLKLNVNTLNATGSVIGNAAALAAGMNVVALADNTTAVILPVAEAGMVVMVRSTVNSKTLPVFPQVNSAIDLLGANNAMTLYQAAVGASAIFVAGSATLWHSFESEDGS